MMTNTCIASELATSAGRHQAQTAENAPLTSTGPTHTSGTVVTNTKSTDSNIPSASAAARAHEGVAALSPNGDLGTLRTPATLTPLATLVQLLLPAVDWLDI
jgi:hypothetical protein